MNGYSWRCDYCGYRLTVKDENNIENVQRTHILTKCKKVSDKERAWWRAMPQS